MSKITDQLQRVSKKKFEEISKRHDQFRENFADSEKEVVKVFDPLPQKLVDELELIREVSRELQAKKEEDMQKQAQAASLAEEEAKKAAEEEKAKKKEEEVEKKE